jgi:DNA-binding NarL/FixJ family response regulator
MSDSTGTGPTVTSPTGTGPEVIGVLLVDDHPVVRDGLRGMFEPVPDIAVVGEAGDGQAGLDQIERLQPDVVLLDLRMPGLGGVAMLRALRQRAAQAPPVHQPRVLVLTTFDSDADVLPAIEAGATGFLLKDVAGDELVRAVRAAHRGEATLSPSLVGRLMVRAGAPPAPAREFALSPRELDVLRLVAGGASNRAAAEALFVSETTVKTHLVHVFDKLDVRDRAAAVDVAHRRGLLG